ncbi:ParA family protein [Salmonella enterica subsp. enterica serovar Newport]|nr:ParA family protein [Salmonella enterica subsp. enterica serovar Newport]
MRIISFLNAKGGVGKTTTALCVAWCLARMGFKVCVVDTDPQLSVSGWHNPEICPFDVYEASNEREIYALRKTLKAYDYVIIDGAAAISVISAAAVMVSDVVLIPVTASPLDFAASGAIVSVLEAREALKPVTARFLITKQVTNARMTKTLREAIKETDIDVMKQGTKHRQAYVKFMLDGGCVFTGDDSQAKAEIELITREIVELAA